ncbi:molybdopterin cofactor-binding domain-containing protein [Roseomonas sp. WA12]
MAMNRRNLLRLSAAATSAGALVLAIGPSVVQADAAVSFQQSYLRIGTDNSVVVISPVAEIGQGTSTALAMVLADALDAEWKDIRFELAPLAPQFRHPTFKMQFTGASTGTSGFHDLYRLAGATARAMLISAAARRWRVSPEGCETSAGRVLLKGGRRSNSYGELAIAAAREAPPATLSETSGRALQFVGRAVPRLDTPSKVDGTAQYAIDVRLPGMLYASVTACPIFGGTLARDNRAEVLRSLGVHSVVDLPNAVAVVADRWWTAHSAIETLAPEWTAGTNVDLSDQLISSQLWRDLRTEQGALAGSAGEPAQAVATAERLLRREYEVPFLAHTTMEPMSCVARVDANRCEIWVSAQRPESAREAVAEQLGMPQSAITIHPVLGGGGFGRRQEFDVIVQAVAIAKSVRGWPVKLLWSREEDVQHDYYRPAGVSELTASISGGIVTSVRHRQATPSVLPRAFPTVAAVVPYDITVSDGVYPIYRFPSQDAHWIRSETPVPTGMWRSVGASHTIFAIESFVDELAEAVGEDALAFRRRHLLHDARAIAALDRLAEICDWPKATAEGRAVGLAVSHKNEDCLVAQAAEVVRQGDGIKVRKIWTVADAGRTIAPDIARSQIEGAAIWGLTAALFGKITIANGRVQETNFDTYQMVRLAETPDFETVFLESGAPMEGIGEGGAPGVAPAVCNALYRLTGRRIRHLPVMPHLV